MNPDIKKHIESIKEETLKTGSHIPMLLVNGFYGNEIVGFADMPQEWDERMKAFVSIGLKLGDGDKDKKQIGAIKSILFVSEGWGLKQGKKDIEWDRKKYPHIADHPDRVEYLMIVGFDLEKKVTKLQINKEKPNLDMEIGEMCEMVRDKKGKLIKLEPMEGYSKMSSPLLEAFLMGWGSGFFGTPLPPGLKRFFTDD